VECYAGYRGEETPRRIDFGSRSVTVVEVVDGWLSPDHRYFKVQCDDGASYVLRHDTNTQTWEVILFEARPGP
jgi:hypothetical protein